MTRPEPGALGDRLATLGATVVHVPLIEIGEPPTAAPRCVARCPPRRVRLARRDVGERRRVGSAPAAAGHPRRAARGRRAGDGSRAGRGGRAVRDLVPAVHRAEGLLAAFPPAPLASCSPRPTGPGARSPTVSPRWVTASRSSWRTARPSAPPTPDEVARLHSVDAAVLASGSAAASWAAAIGSAIARASSSRSAPSPPARPPPTGSTTCTWRRRPDTTLGVGGAGRAPTMTGDARSELPRRPAPSPAPYAGPPRPRRRDRAAHERPDRPAVRARGPHRAAADRVAARHRPAQPREPAQGGRRARRRSACVPSCCSVCRPTRTPSAAGRSIPRASCSWPSPTSVATSATRSC